MLGVIIGVASVIVMVSVASGAGEAIEARIKALGTNVLVIMPGSFTSGGRRAGEGTALGSVRRRSCRHPLQGAERRRRGGHGQRLGARLVVGNANWTTSVNGVNEDFLEVRDWPLADGRSFTDAELRSGAKVVILGATTHARAVRLGPGRRRARCASRTCPSPWSACCTTKGQSGLGHRSGRHRARAVVDREAAAVRGRANRAGQSPPDHGRGRFGRSDGRRAGGDRESVARAAPCQARLRLTTSRCATWRNSSGREARRRAS